MSLMLSSKFSDLKVKLSIEFRLLKPAITLSPGILLALKPFIAQMTLLASSFQ